MRNKKGQALVEFVLILPVFLLFIVGLIDMGNLIYEKYKLEDHLDYVVELYKQDKKMKIQEYAKEENINLELVSSSDYTTITLTKNVKMTTPILKEMIGKNHIIETERTIYETSNE